MDPEGEVDHYVISQKIPKNKHKQASEINGA